MNPVAYSRPADPEAPIVWCCGRCGMLYPSGTKPRLADDPTEQARSRAYQSAAECCQCVDVGCVAPREKPYIRCAAHLDEHAAEWEAAAWAEIAALPVTHGHPGPWYDHRTNSYAEDAEDLLDRYGWNEDDLEGPYADGFHWEVRPLISPCDARQVGCPPLAQIVEEVWAEAFNSEYEYEMDGDTRRILEAVEQVISERSPIEWVPRRELTDVRWDEAASRFEMVYEAQEEIS